ncbi:hypothetical protein ACYSNW_06840 [Enterococcus sp. LJL99]
MADRVISTANLNVIEGSLATLNNRINTVSSQIDAVNSQVGAVDQNLKTVYQELEGLAREFHDYVNQANMQHNVSLAETRLVKIRQELETKYGHYAEVRRTTLGVLQADDLEVVRKETIKSMSEELMLNSPNYWLAPCIVAISAWINDEKELAERAVKEAIRRDDEKTSLLFSLVNRRAGKKQASLKWVSRYLANQSEEELDRKTIIIIDAFTSGLLGVDSEGIVSRKLTEWLDKISEKPGFSEQQIDQWSQAINLYRPANPEVDYPYLEKYSSTYPQIVDVLKGALLHEQLLSYFVNIFKQPNSTLNLKEQLDDILFNLVSSFDEEEVPLRKNEMLNELIIRNDGDKTAANNEMKIEETALEQKKDYSQLLTDAALKPEKSAASFSTQKYAISVSKNWILDAYNDVVAKNRAKIPHKIQLEVNGFVATTVTGVDEEELLNQYDEYMEEQKQERLKQLVPTKVGFFVGGAIGLIGLFMLFGMPFLGLIALIAGGFIAYTTNNKNKQIEYSKAQISQEIEDNKNKGKQIIRAFVAETVDFRNDFEKLDSKSKQVISFLNQLSPEHYIRSLAGENRRVKVGGN